MKVFISASLLAVVLSFPGLAQEKPAHHAMSAPISNDADFVHIQVS